MARAMKPPEYDLAVIGAGAAGLTAAAAAAALGAKTVLVEAVRFGGDCTWHGCVPSKALLRAARAAAETRGAERFGVSTTVSIDGPRVLARVRAMRERIYAAADAPDVLARYGIETVRARARFVDAHTLALSSDEPRSVSARRIVIATGSRPRPLGLGIPSVDTDSIWEIETLPARLLVVGGGPVAVELAQAWARLGVAVCLVTGAPRILARDDPSAAAIVAGALERDGVTIRTGRRVASASHDGTVTTARLDDGTIVLADLVLAALGRIANVQHLGLERAAVRVRDGLVAVDRRSRTSVRHVYAAGDCATTARFTHVAERMAAVAVLGAIVGYPERFDPESITWTTFTAPELAQVGPTEDELRRANRRFVVHRFPASALDRAVIDGAEMGYSSIVTTPRGRVLGGTVVGPRAGEAIAEIALARARRLPIRALSATLHAYPTYAFGVRRAADLALVRARTAPLLAALRFLRRLRGKPTPLDVLLP
ncbi:MAG: FAD-dependent oxidoreductase [Vulcanimicrobiaceae bacterium]